MFEDWNASSKTFVDRLQSDPRSELCKHGSRLYAVNMNKGKEVRAGWKVGNGDRNACMARIVAKADGSIDLYLHLDPSRNLIGEGKPFKSAFHGNETDRDMGKVNLSESNFPEAVFEWIACASKHSRKKHNIQISATEISATAETPVTQPKPAPKVDPEEEFREGQRKLRIHHDIERNTKAIRQKRHLFSLKPNACYVKYVILISARPTVTSVKASPSVITERQSTRSPQNRFSHSTSWPSSVRTATACCTVRHF